MFVGKKQQVLQNIRKVGSKRSVRSLALREEACQPFRASATAAKVESDKDMMLPTGADNPASPFFATVPLALKGLQSRAYVSAAYEVLVLQS